jgi:hypothetical protein
MQGISSRRLIFAGALLSFMMAAVPASAQCTAKSYTVALPHIAYGGGWQTTLLLRNTGSGAASVTACYYADSGSALSVPFNGSGATSSTVNIPANGQAEITPDSSGSGTIAGWVGFPGGLPTGVSAQAVFVSTFPAAPPLCIISFPDQNSTSTSQAVAPIVTGTGASLSMPFDNTNGQVSGYALANTSDTPVNVTLTFYSESGAQIATYSPAQLAAFGHTEFLLNQSGLPAALADQKGVMVISSSSVFPLGFRFSISGSSILSFSTWLP